MRGPLRLRTVIPVALAALALPATAAAHGRTATIALDYRLALDSLDARPAGRARAHSRRRPRLPDPGRPPATTLLVRGSLNEPLLRIDASGVWVNADSPTATGDKIVSASRHGWVHLSGGRTVTWHDHRLAPPPCEHASARSAGSSSPSRSTASRPRSRAPSSGSPARPLWPWLLGALVLAGAILARDPAPPAAGAADDRARRRRRSRRARRGDDVRRPRCADRRRRLAPARDGVRSSRRCSQACSSGCTAALASTPRASSARSRPRSASARRPSSGTGSSSPRSPPPAPGRPARSRSSPGSPPPA